MLSPDMILEDVHYGEELEGIGFDFQEIRIDGLLVDKHANERNEKWGISLPTTMYTKTQNDGRDMYSIRWRFKDLWGNLPWFVYIRPRIIRGPALKLCRLR